MGNKPIQHDKHTHKVTDKYRQSYSLLVNESDFMNTRFNEYFIEISGFGRNLYKFFTMFKTHDYYTYVQIIEILTKYEPELDIHKEAGEMIAKTSIFDRFAMIVLGIYDTKVYLAHTSTEEDKIGLITHYFELFTRKIDRKDVEKAFNYLEKTVRENPNTKQFIQGFREFFPYSQQHLISYYKAKFTQITKEYFGILDPKSKLLSLQDWIILSMKAPKIRQNTPPTLLYSADIHGTSFSSLQTQIIGYTGAWLLVLQHIETDIETKQKTRYVIGSYQNAPVKDVHNYQGTSECFLFRVCPSIRYMVPGDGEGDSNYFYIFGQVGVKGKKRGLGFGGRDFDSFKIWIDEQIEDKSYVNNGLDLTYGYGYIASPGTDKLSVRMLEIWGLGTQQNLVEQEEYKKERIEQATRRRKVNKQELMKGGIATQLIFDKSFAHRDQIQGELPERQMPKKQ